VGGDVTPSKKRDATALYSALSTSFHFFCSPQAARDPTVIAAFSRDSASANLYGAKLALPISPLFEDEK
jgi:hypothetical protein